MFQAPTERVRFRHSLPRFGFTSTGGLLAVLWPITMVRSERSDSCCVMIDNRYRPVIKPSRLLVLSRRLYSPLGEEESSHAPLDEPPEIKLNPEKFAMGLKFHFGPHVYCLHGVAHLRKIPHVSTTFGKKWIHGVSSIYTSGIHYVSDTPRVSSGYPMYPVYPYVSLCIRCVLSKF